MWGHVRMTAAKFTLPLLVSEFHQRGVGVLQGQCSLALPNQSCFAFL
eukprot:COSAG01_NODE_53979_length_335_cov_0.881356_1_plen_46_part_01